MVNTELKRRSATHPTHSGTAKTQGKSRVSSVNESFSKRLEFSENFGRIRFECTQKRELALQPCLLACVMRRHHHDSRATVSR
jgi:hypothetical protein